MNIVIWLCLAVMVAIVLTSIVNVAKRNREERLDYYDNYKKGKFWAIYFVSIPLYYLANRFNGLTIGECIFNSMKSGVELVVLKFDYSTVMSLMNANAAYKAAIVLCYVLVTINAGFLAFTIAGRRALNGAWKKLAKSSKKCYVVVGFNEQNKSIVKSLAKDGKRADCIVVAPSICDDLKKTAFVNKVAYSKIDGAEEFANKLLKMFKDFSTRSVEVIVNTQDDKTNLVYCEQIARVILQLKLEEYGADSDRGLNAYVFGEPENMSSFLKYVKDTSGCVHYVNKYKLIAYDFVDKYPLTEFMSEEQIDFDSATVQPDVSLNVALIGFGKTNRQIFLTSVENNQFMTLENGELVQKNVNYFIYDKKDARNDKNLNHDYYRFQNELSGTDYLPLPQKPANENFFELDINDDEFYCSLRNNLCPKGGQKKFNYLVIAFGSDLENLDFAEKMCTKLKEWGAYKQTKVFVKIRDDKFTDIVLDGFEARKNPKNKETKNAEQLAKDYIVFGNENSLVYNVGAIVNEPIERVAMDRHLCYELANAYKYQEGGKEVNEAQVKLQATKGWYTQEQFQREANVYAILAVRMKLQLLGFDYCDVSDNRADASDEFMQKYQQGGPIIYDGAVCGGRKSVVYTTDFNFDSLRGHMAIQEHQRWNAYTITCGMCPMPLDNIRAGIYKDFDLRQHACLTTFDGLVEYRKIRAAVDSVKYNKVVTEQDVDVIKYDYQIMDDIVWLVSRFGKKIVKKQA